MKNCRLLKRIFLALMFGISMGLVSACGGSAGEQEPASTKPVSTRDVRPSLAADTSGIAIAASVTKIESPLATAEIGKNVAVVDSNGKSENVIFALDNAGEVIFIGSDSGDQTIGIETTAKYLAWMGLLVSDNPADSPVDQVRPLLMATKSYAALVSAVKSELSNGIPISKSNILGDYISNVVLEAQLMYAESIKNSPTAQTQAVNNVSQLDYYVINRDGDEKLWISNKDAQNITLNNRTFLFWTAQSKNIENNQLITASTLVLPLKTTQSQLYAYYEGSESKTQLGTALHTEIKIGQDSQSINANAMMLVTRSTFAIIDISMVALGGSPDNVQKCVVGVTKNITNNPKFAMFVLNPSNDGFVNFLQSIDSIDAIQRVLECSNAKYITNSSWYKSINRSLAPIRAGRSANSAFSTLAQLVRYSTRSDTFELCRYAGAVAPCVRRLAGPAEVTIGGESSTISVSAFGDLDVPIVSPPSLALKSTDPAIVTVDPVNSGGKISIKGIANGTAQLVVTEPVTGVVLSPAITVHVLSGFTKISAAGADLPPDATTWSCVRQNATGLLWEAHVTRRAPGHLCPWSYGIGYCLSYTNFGDGLAEYDASAVPATVGSLCGKVGWRLPTEAEGRALVSDPAYINRVDSSWFGKDDAASSGWTDSKYEGDTSGFGVPFFIPDGYTRELAWYIDFSSGYMNINYRVNSADGDIRVRLVR